MQKRHTVWTRLGLGLILLLQGCALPHAGIDVSGIMPAGETAYARVFNPFVLQRHGAAIQNEALQEYLTRTAARLLPGAQGKTFTAVNDPAPAAFALPGGEIVISRGLLYELESETELLVLLAHLLGHDRARHGLQAALAQQPERPEPAGLPVPAAATAATASEGFARVVFSEAQEITADRNALDILATAGLDPASLAPVLSALHSRLDALPEPQSGTFGKSHPLSSSRLRAAAESARSLVFDSAAAGDEPDTPFEVIRSELLASRPAYDLYLQALHLEQRGAIDQAIDLYLQAAVAAPEEPLPLTGLGMAYMRQEALVAARQHLTRAARIDPYYYYPQLGLGYIYLQQKDFTQAVKRLRHSQNLLPTAQGAYLLAQVFDAAGDVRAAGSAYREVVQNYAGSRMATLAAERIVELESGHELE